MKLKHCCFGSAPLGGLPLPAASPGDPHPRASLSTQLHWLLGSAPRQVSALVRDMSLGARQIWAGDLTLPVADSMTWSKPLLPFKPVSSSIKWGQ